jgi:putative ABC transport system permease protein
MRRLLLKLWRRRRLHDDLDAELAFHREMSASHGNAVTLGNTSRIVEASLDVWRFTTIENLWRDVVYAVRGLSHSPAFVASAVLSLGLGIGVNTTIFSLGVELLLSQPSLSDPSSVVNVHVGGNSAAQPRVFDFVQRSGVFRDVVGENEETFLNWNDGHETRRIFGVVTSKNYFTALGIPIEHGRGILPTDPDEVVVLQNRFWRVHYDANPAVVGRSILLEGKPYLVVGILPASHRTLIGFGFSPDVYVPKYLPETLLSIYARMPPGLSLDQARAAVRTLADRLDATFPQEYKFAWNENTVTPVSGFARLRQEPQIMTVGFFFLALLAVVGLVLLIACINVTGLLLARASARRREFAIRLSLGASRGRLLQQLLVESFVLAVMGAGLGFALAEVSASLFALVHLPLPLPIRLQVEPDWRVTLYAAGLSILAALGSGLLPAWQAVRESMAPELARAQKLRLRKVLVAGQLAVSLVVLATAMLFLRNLLAANGISPGFDLQQTIRAEINLPSGAYETPAAIAAYVARALPALEATPGIEAAAAAQVLPFTDSIRFGSEITLPDGAKVQSLFHWNAISPDYFRVMQIPFVGGRAFTDADRGGDRVAIVNRAFVEHYLGRRAPVGLDLRWGRNPDEHYRVVGVVEGTKNVSVGEDDRPQLYEPLPQVNSNRRRFQFVLRSSMPPALQVDPVRRALRAIEPGAGAEVATLHSSIGLAFLPSRVGAVLLGSIGLLGLALAAVGLYGMMAYSVARRLQEIGIRLALGATGGDIARMVFREAVMLVGIGAATGVAVALFVMRPLTMFLVSGLLPSDPLTLGVVVLVLTLTGLLAAWGPARRAASIDPITALRYE